MKKLLVALAMVSTLSASVSANCVGIYENILNKTTRDGSKNIFALAGEELGGLFKELMFESPDLGSKIVAIPGTIIISPLFLAKAASFKSTYGLYSDFISVMNDNENQKSLNSLKNKMARRYDMTNEEFLDVLNYLNATRDLCAGSKVTQVLTPEGMEYIRSRGYDSFTEAAMNGKNDPETFNEMFNNPSYYDYRFGSPLDKNEFKKVVRSEIEARGFEKKPLEHRSNDRR